MGRIISIFFCVLLSNSNIAFAQFDTALHLQEAGFIEGSYSDFYIDNLNNIFLLNKNNQLKKIDGKGDSVAVSNALRMYGDIYSMDVSNPLKILVYYKDFATILVLDRFLSRINTIDLRKYGILESQAVAQSYDNNYWVFDEVENKLKKIDDNGNMLLETSDFRAVFNESFSPEKIIDNNGLVYLYNKKAGWLVFDYYGAFKQGIASPGWRYVQVLKNDLCGFDTSHLYRYNTRTFKETSYSINLRVGFVIKLQAEMNLLYALMQDGLHIYSIHD